MRHGTTFFLLRNRTMNVLLCYLCAMSAESGESDPFASAWGMQPRPVSLEGCCKCFSSLGPEASVALSLRGGGLDLGGYERPELTLQKHRNPPPTPLVPQRPSSSETTGAKAGSSASASSGISQHAQSPIAPAKAHGIPATFLSEMGGSWYAGDAAEDGKTLKGCGNHEEERTHSDDLVVDEDRRRGGGLSPPPPPPGGGGVGGGEFVDGGIGYGIEEEKEEENEEGESMEDEEAGISSGGGIGYDVQQDVLQEEERETDRMEAVVEEIEREVKDHGGGNVGRDENGNIWTQIDLGDDMDRDELLRKYDVASTVDEKSKHKREASPMRGEGAHGPKRKRMESAGSS